MKHILDLTEDCYLILFSQYFTLQEQLHLRQVCGRWQAVIESGLCAPKKSLQLFTSLDGMKSHCEALADFNIEDQQHFRLNKHNLLMVSWPKLSRYRRNYLPSANRCNFLARIFPRVQHLTICMNSSRKSAINFVFLIEAWSHTLTSLTISDLPGKQLDNHCQVNQQFWCALNGVTNLRSLHLFYQEMYMEEQNSIPNRMPVLGKLHELSLFQYEKGNIFSVLQQLGPQMENLRLHMYPLWRDPRYEQIATINPNLTNLANLTIRINGMYTDLIASQLIVKNFLNLSYLDLTNLLDEQSLPDCFKDLQKLTNLRELKMKLHQLECPQLNYYAQNRDNLDQAQVARNVTQYIANYPRLNNVKLFHLADKANQISQFPHHRLVAHIFPVMDELTLWTNCDKTSHEEIRAKFHEFFQNNVTIQFAAFTSYTRMRLNGALSFHDLTFN